MAWTSWLVVDDNCARTRSKSRLSVNTSSAWEASILDVLMGVDVDLCWRDDDDDGVAVEYCCFCC